MNECAIHLYPFTPRGKERPEGSVGHSGLYCVFIGFLLQVKTLADSFIWVTPPTIDGEFREQRCSVSVTSLSQILQ